MFDRNSDYALNKKDPDAIVCKSSTGVHIRLTRLDFSSQEEFEKWKQWSDDDYHCTEKKDHVYANHTVPTDKLVEVSITVISPEEELMEATDGGIRQAGTGAVVSPVERRPGALLDLRPAPQAVALFGGLDRGEYCKG